MCWMCDHPGATEADYQDHLRRLIGTFGWAVQGVERDGDHPPYAYTVGLAGMGMPELVITGTLDLDQAAVLLNLGVLRSSTRIQVPGERFRLPRGPLVEVVTVTSPWAHLLMAVALYGERFDALQLVHADRHRRWPWEAGYAGVTGGQPVLGVRATAREPS